MHRPTLFPALLVAALTLAAVAAPAVAQGPGGPHGGPGAAMGAFGQGGPAGLFSGHRLRFLTDYLELNDQQVAAAKDLGQQLAAAVKPLFTEAHQLRQELETALGASNPDPSQVGSLAISLHAKREQIRTTMDDFRGQFRALLTQQQQQRLDDLERLRGEHRGWKHGPRG